MNRSGRKVRVFAAGGFRPGFPFDGFNRFRLGAEREEEKEEKKRGAEEERRRRRRQRRRRSERGKERGWFYIEGKFELGIKLLD